MMSNPRYLSKTLAIALALGVTVGSGFITASWAEYNRDKRENVRDKREDVRDRREDRRDRTQGII